MATETAVGTKGWLVGVAESTWGTTPGTTPKRVPFINESIKASIGIVEDETIRNDRGNDTPAQGLIDPAGDINVTWTADAHAWLFWRGVGGTVVVTGSAPYTHTFSEYTSPDLPSFSLEKGFTDVGQYFVETGNRINRMTFNLQPGQNVKGVISVMGKSETASGTPLNASPTTIARKPLDAFSGTLTESSTALATATEMTLTILNNVNGVNVLFSQFKGALLAARLKISGTLTAFFTNLTLYNRFRNFTESNIIVKMQDSAANFIQIHTPHIRYAGSTPAVSGEGPIFIPLEFNAYTDSVANVQLLCVVKNTLSTITT